MEIKKLHIFGESCHCEVSYSHASYSIKDILVKVSLKDIFTWKISILHSHTNLTKLACLSCYLAYKVGRSWDVHAKMDS